MKERLSIYLPLILAFTFVGGFYVGSQYSGGLSTINTKTTFPLGKKFNKLNEVVNYIENEYVDSIEREQLTDRIITNLLQELDPHSYYMSAEETKRLNEPLEGGFEGIGVQFSIQADTIVVINPVSGGPSEKLGIQPGDRIVKVDGEVVAGVNISNSEVMKKLKGPSGTKVNVEIMRSTAPKLLSFDITRDRIPIHSVDAYYLIREGTAYVKLSRFSRNTYQEFMEASSNLLDDGMKRMIIDLRGNGGGIMSAATDIADEFLEEGSLIVYTEGKARPKESFFATSKGILEDTKLVILIDEASASASEIIAGAIQDNDRGLIIGRRSFGKGLVQEQSDWPDGSATRLTIARYYTPSGRSIQKPYDKGSEAYHKEYYERYENGELESADSVVFADSLKYTTIAGRTVYGGGGIMPDIFVPIDTIGNSWYLSELYYSGQFYDFCFEYTDKNRMALDRFEDHLDFQKNFQVDDELLKTFAQFASDNGVKEDPAGLKKSEEVIRFRIKAGISRNLYNDQGFYPVINEFDPVIKKALKNFNTDLLSLQ